MESNRSKRILIKYIFYIYFTYIGQLLKHPTVFEYADDYLDRGIKRTSAVRSRSSKYRNRLLYDEIKVVENLVQSMFATPGGILATMNLLI